MKYIKLLESNKLKLEDCIEGTYIINKDGINVNGSVNLSKKNLVKIPWKFNIVTGVFDCSYNKIDSLENSPKKCNSFICSYNKLKSLKGSPKICNNFDCSSNKLKSLEGSPKKVKVLNCSYNELELLNNIEFKSIYLYSNNFLSLKGYYSLFQTTTEQGLERNKNLDIFNIPFNYVDTKKVSKKYTIFNEKELNKINNIFDFHFKNKYVTHYPHGYDRLKVVKIKYIIESINLPFTFEITKYKDDYYSVRIGNKIKFVDQLPSLLTLLKKIKQLL